MKRQIITLSAALLSLGTVNAQDTYFDTDFEQGMPQSFTLHDEDGRTPSTDMTNLGFAVGTPWIVTAEGKDGNHVACSTSWYKNAGQSDDWMVTGAITVKSAEAVLNWRARASDKDYRDGYKVFVSEIGTSVADFDRTSPLFSISKETYAWNDHSVSLAAYAGKTIYIAFVNDSKDKTCLYIDDLFVGVPSCFTLTTNLVRVINSYGDVAVTGTIVSSKDLSGCTIGYDIDGQHYEQAFTDAIKKDAVVSFTLNQPFSIGRNETLPYTVYVKNDGDSTGLKGRVSAYPWKQVAEEVTGTWCGYCVRGIVGMKTMRENYPDSFIGIAVHNSTEKWEDAMAAGVEDYLETLYSSCGITGYPHAVYNRNVMYSIDPIELESNYLTIVASGTNNCGVQLKASYDEATDKIQATTDVYFAADVENANYRLAYVLVENNVHRTNAQLGIPEGKATGYEQCNYYAGGSNGAMGGFEDLPYTVPADKMWYNDVARAIWPNYSGLEGIIPTAVSEGDHYTHTYTMDMPATVLEKPNTELVVLLMDKNGVIVNADKVAIEGTSTGISTMTCNPSVANDAYYTLGGMRVSQPGHGIYIHHGKKVVR